MTFLVSRYNYQLSIRSFRMFPALTENLRFLPNQMRCTLIFCKQLPCLQYVATYLPLQNPLYIIRLSGSDLS